MAYCTTTEVLNIARNFKRDLDRTGNITTPDVQAAADEATDMVNMLLQPNYAISTIEGYSPTYPPVVVALAATYSAILLTERFGATSVDKNEKLVDRYKRSMDEYKQIITNGALVDASGVRVTAQSSPVLKQDTTNYVANSELQEIYENGRFY